MKFLLYIQLYVLILKITLVKAIQWSLRREDWPGDGSEPLTLTAATLKHPANYPLIKQLVWSIHDYWPTILFVMLWWKFYTLYTKSNIHGDAQDESEIQLITFLKWLSF